MAKDRFSRQKPIYWNKGFKETGSMIKPYSPSKEEKKTNDSEEKRLINWTFKTFESYLNPWEKEFLASLLFSSYILSSKQKLKIKEIGKKYITLYPEKCDFRPPWE